MNSFKSFFLLLSTLFALTTAKYHINPDGVARIINGFDAKDGQFPHLVSVQLNYENKHFCGGAIVNSHWIVTAAHCTRYLYDPDKLTPDNFYIVAGTTDLRNPRFIYNVSRIINHPKYHAYKVLDMDISLLQTTQEIVFNELVQPIALPTIDTPGDIPVTVAGWGNTINGVPGHFPMDLQVLHQRTLSQEACVEDYPHLRKISSTVICASVDNAAVGGSDSGGPLITNENVLVGVVSAGTGPGRFADIYTRVYSALDFIYSHIGEKPNIA